jgi:hypothetical protein
MNGRQLLLASSIASASVFLCGCPPTYNATATCTNKADITSVDFGPTRVGTTSIGLLNTHHFGPGDLIELVPPQAGQTLGSGSRVDTLSFPSSAFVPDDPPTTTSQVISTDFELSVDAELKAFTAQIQTALTQNTQLVLTGGSRHALQHPLDILNASQSDTSRILQHPDRLYILVNGIVNGTDVSLQYANSKTGSANVSILKIPGTKFNVSVTYKCSNVTELKATGSSPAGLAFFYMTLQAVSGKVDTVATADLTKYSLSNALF